jgi:hypothetical protein
VHVRGLPVAQQPLLLLKLLPFIVILSPADQGFDGVQVALMRYLELCVLLPDPI